MCLGLHTHIYKIINIFFKSEMGGMKDRWILVLINLGSVDLSCVHYPCSMDQ